MSFNNKEFSKEDIEELQELCEGNRNYGDDALHELINVKIPNILKIQESLRGNKIMLKRAQELGLNAELFRYEIKTLIMGEEGEWVDMIEEIVKKYD